MSKYAPAHIHQQSGCSTDGFFKRIRNVGTAPIAAQTWRHTFATPAESRFHQSKMTANSSPIRYQSIESRCIDGRKMSIRKKVKIVAPEEAAGKNDFTQSPLIL